MLHSSRYRYWNLHRGAVFGGLLLTLLAVLPNSVKAQCSTGWDASGEWDFRQVGQRRLIKLRLDQKGQALTGSAVLPEGRKTPATSGGIFGSFSAAADLNGTADGYITADDLNLHIFWQNGATGVYSARILPSGKVEGKGHEKGSPHILVSWDSVARLKCPPPPPVIPKVIKSSGKAKVKPAPAQTSQPAPPPMKVPGIITSQVIYPYPNVPAGFIILTWDAGPDHPYAEVWFKIGGPTAPATFLVEQGKGSRQIPVERYKYYSYTLTDAGKTLAEVSFVAQ